LATGGTTVTVARDSVEYGFKGGEFYRKYSERRITVKVKPE